MTDNNNLWKDKESFSVKRQEHLWKKPGRPDSSVLILAEHSRAALLKMSIKSCFQEGMVSFLIMYTIFSFDLKNTKLLFPHPL